MDRKAVVWISTILYTVISLAIIGLLLSVIQPMISQWRDSLIIDQTKASLAKVDESVQNVQGEFVGRRYVEFKLGKGTLTLSGKNNSITWTIDTKVEYSNPNQTMSSGNIYERTDKMVDMYRVSLFLEYKSINLTFNGKDADRVLQPAPNPYKIWFENKGSYIDMTIG
jgi:hypothetical protein